MSGNRNIVNRIDEFFRYIRNELSGDERNLFERGIQKDPFEEDALDGLSNITEQSAVEDLSELKERLRKRTFRKNSFLLYRIAGIIVLLISISAVLVVTVLKKPDNQLAINTPELQTIEIAKNQPVIVSDSKDNAFAEREEKKSFTESDQNEATGAANNSVNQEKNDELSYEIIPPGIAIMSKEEKSKRLAISAPSAALARSRSTNGYTVSGRVVSSDDNMPIPGASVQIKGTFSGVTTNTDGNFNINLPDSSGKTLVASFIGMESQEIRATPDSQLQIRLNSSVSALSEVVVTGYGSKKSDAMEQKNISDYLHPQPATGQSMFNEYIKNNLNRPDNSDGDKKMVVVLSFLVRTSGEIDSIRIIRSPGRAYSDEAIRVLQSGPAWNPATDNGKPVEEDVRLRIVFR